MGSYIHMPGEQRSLHASASVLCLCSARICESACPLVQTILIGDGWAGRIRQLAGSTQRMDRSCSYRRGRGGTDRFTIRRVHENV